MNLTSSKPTCKCGTRWLTVYSIVIGADGKPDHVVWSACPRCDPRPPVGWRPELYL